MDSLIGVIYGLLGPSPKEDQIWHSTRGTHKVQVVKSDIFDVYYRIIGRDGKTSDVVLHGKDRYEFRRFYRHMA